MGKTSVRKYSERGFEFVALDNGLLRAVFLPEIGGKMVEMRDGKSGEQFLLEPQTESGWYERPDFGREFEEYDTSGFDECFPTVTASSYHTPGGSVNTEFPDHGELWSRPWKYEIRGDELILSVEGVRADYLFEKRVSMVDKGLLLQYKVTNRMTEPFFCLWSAHPLLKVREGARFLLPEDVERVFVHWASHKELGKHGDRLRWPYLDASSSLIDYSVVQGQQLGRACKCFTDALSEGFAGVYDAGTNQSILFEFDPKENPYLGLWLCYGGWPTGSRRKHLTVAFEPCSGRPDSLSEAMKRGECLQIPARGAKSWSLRVSLWQGVPRVAKPASVSLHSVSPSPS